MLKPCVHLSSPVAMGDVLGEIGEMDMCGDPEHCYCESWGRTVGGC